MVGRSGRGNWANAAARARARRGRLLDHARMRQFLQQTPDQLSTSIADAGYRADIDLYADRLSGADLIEVAVQHHLEREVREVLGFCKGTLHTLVGLYAHRFGYQNAKTVLRAVHNGSDVEEVRRAVLPQENELNLPWLEIVRNARSLAEAAEQMRGTAWGSAVADVPAGSDLSVYEDTLDQHDHRELAAAIASPRLRGTPLARFFASEIDHRNLINLLRGLRAGLSTDARLELLLPGGRAFRTSLLRQAAAAESQAALLEIVRRSPRVDVAGFEQALQRVTETDSLDAVHAWLAEQRTEILQRMAYLHPISAVPVVHYLARKVAEVADLRLIARGLSAGLTREDIEPRLVN